jgi:hypothetical protein
MIASVLQPRFLSLALLASMSVAAGAQDVSEPARDSADAIQSFPCVDLFSPFITAPTYLGAGGSGTASVPAQSGSTYSWTLQGGTINSGQGQNLISFTAGSAGTAMIVAVVRTNSGSCSTSE